MSLKSLHPVSQASMNSLVLAPDQVIGKTIDIHTQSSGLPSLDEVKIGIIGITTLIGMIF